MVGWSGFELIVELFDRKRRLKGRKERMGDEVDVEVKFLMVVSWVL